MVTGQQTRRLCCAWPSTLTSTISHPVIYIFHLGAYAVCVKIPKVDEVYSNNETIEYMSILLPCTAQTKNPL